MPTYRLTNFDMKGLAEPIRLALTIGEVPFEDIRVTKDEWDAKKATMPFPVQMPMFEIDDQIIGQSQAILRYAGKLSGTYPKNDDMLALRIDEVLGCIWDLIMKVVASIYEPDEARKTANRKKFVDSDLPEWGQKMEAYFAKQGQTDWAAGKSLSIADLHLFVLMSWLTSGILDNVPTTCLDSYPVLNKIKNNVAAHEKVKAYYAARA